MAANSKIKFRKVIKILNPVIFRFSSDNYKAKTAGISSAVFRY